MKLSRIVTTFVGASLLFAAGAVAQEKSTLNLTEKLNVQGTELKPGRYNIEWEGTGPAVKLNISKGKDTVVTVPATLVPRETPNQGNAYGAKSEGSGSRTLLAIYPAGKKYGVEIGNKQAAAN